MKKSLLIALIAVLPFTPTLAPADEVHHADKGKKSAMAMTDSEKQIQMGKMQEMMLKMHEQMHKISDAKNPQDREKLMQEHAKMMQEHMQMMHMMGQGMKGHGKMSGDAKGDKPAETMKGM